MRNWKIFSIAAALGAILMVLIVRQGSNAAHHAEVVAPPVGSSEIAQSSRPERLDERKSDRDYGWGPFRTTDW